MPVLLVPVAVAVWTIHWLLFEGNSDDKPKKKKIKGHQAYSHIAACEFEDSLIESLLFLKDFEDSKYDPISDKTSWAFLIPLWAFPSTCKSFMTPKSAADSPTRGSPAADSNPSQPPRLVCI